MTPYGDIEHGHHWFRWWLVLYHCLLTDDHHNASLVVSYGISITIVLEIPYFTTKRGLCNGLSPVLCQAITLTHLPLVLHICVSESGQHWFRLWLVAYSAQSHYLNQCSLIVSWTLRNKLQWNSDHNTKLFRFKKMQLKMSSAKRKPFCPGGDELTHWPLGDAVVVLN